MKKIRVILIIISIIAFIWFALPIFLSVSLNIGNMTGMAVSLLLFLLGVFLPQVQGILAVWKEHKKGKWIYRGFLLVIAVVAGLVVVESACMIGAACKKPEAGATVVVLGCRVYGERASLSMVERLEAAYQYLSENETAVCILSGGQGPGEDISEAECMYRYLADKGISPKRLYKEELSASTRENLENAKAMIGAHGLNAQIAIATSEYHQYRAGEIAQALDMEYGAVPAHTAIWLFPTYYVRELYGILYEWFC